MRSTRSRLRSGDLHQTLRSRRRHRGRKAAQKGATLDEHNHSQRQVRTRITDRDADEEVAAALLGPKLRRADEGSQPVG